MNQDSIVGTLARRAVRNEDFSLLIGIIEFILNPHTSSTTSADLFFFIEDCEDLASNIASFKISKLALPNYSTSRHTTSNQVNYEYASLGVRDSIKLEGVSNDLSSRFIEGMRGFFCSNKTIKIQSSLDLLFFFKIVVLGAEFEELDTETLDILDQYIKVYLIPRAKIFLIIFTKFNLMRFLQLAKLSIGEVIVDLVNSFTKLDFCAIEQSLQVAFSEIGVIGADSLCSLEDMFEISFDQRVDGEPVADVKDVVPAC
mmetsp:Transcript_24062/g.21087  ORF Transcript_24062/g.21087 Transcript_24062/m.21087 type:complete len:257 (+) Transcript_24062:3195-3965(+)